MGCKSYFKSHSNRVHRRKAKQNVAVNGMEEDFHDIQRKEVKAADPWTID